LSETILKKYRDHIELNTTCTMCDIAEEIKCFQAVSAHRRSGLHYQLRQCRPCSGRDQNGSRFHVYGAWRERGACNGCTYDPPTRHLWAVFTPFTGLLCMFQCVVTHL